MSYFPTDIPFMSDEEMREHGIKMPYKKPEIVRGIDLVLVVRCKDCRYRENDDFCVGRGFPYQLVPDEGFCDKGKPNTHVFKKDADLISQEGKKRAWKPIEPQAKGTCGTCSHIDWACAYLTCPVQYRCRVTDRMHFLTDECDAEKEEQ